MQADEKACPFCAETIKAAAIVCKHCGRDLPGVGTQSAPGANPIAGLPIEQQHKVRALGITWQQERWVVDGCYFTDLARAIEFGERPRSAPTASAARSSGHGANLRAHPIA